MTEEPAIVTGTADWRNLSVLENGSLIFDCDDFNGNIPFTSTLAQVILYILYGSMFVIALGGNSLVCAAVIRTRNNLRPNNLTNYFIVNLAIGDILINIFCVPTSVLSTLVFHYWLLPSQLCAIFNFFQAVAVLVSAYTLVVISMERYLAIMYLFRPRRGTKYAKISILIVWLLAMAISLPILVVSDVEQPDIRYEMCDFYTCTEKWSDKKQKYSYTIALLILQYLVPLLILLFSYISIAIVVWGKKAPGEAEDNRDQRMIRSKTKTIKMLMAVVIVYTICWLPFNVLNLVMDINEDINRWYGLPYIWAMLHWLAMSHACYNPFIYCWMSTPFRQGIFNMLKCVPIIRRFVPDRSHALNTSAVGIPLTGFDGQHNSSLRRKNNCTTYVSVRKKMNHNHGAPIRSASFRCNNSLRSSGPMHRHFVHLEVQQEESL
ncbi:RYamide receptor isoform X4 [Nasonia vitripennis]|nr:RYamide receptor isoform X4 [Nasonia vitripennis]